jgi:hypothetical protein
MMTEPFIPLSVLELDLPAPAIGWAAGLAEKGISTVLDDLGRLCVPRDVARQLFAKHRESEVRRREVMARIERQAEEKDREFRAQLWGGIRADHMPPGVAPAAVMLQSARDSQPKRATPLEESLAGETMTYHAWPNEDES